MFQINGKDATGTQAELHYMNWCLALEQEHATVPHSALEVMSDFQRGAFRGDEKALARINLSGIQIH